jgi:predicted transcriptional regulator
MGEGNDLMLNSETFLSSFAVIERYLRNYASTERQTTFYQLVEQVARSNSAVRHYEKDLKEYADLRNAIVHERGDGHIIAEPNEIAVSGIKNIALLLTKPPTVIPAFQNHAIVLSASDSIAGAVKMMLECSISQIPIKTEKGFTGLLTTNTIARWLGACVQEDYFSLNETSIEQVMRYTEDADNYAFLNRNATIFEAIDLFQRYENSGKRLEAILITNSGRPTEQIVGIITVADLPRAFGAIAYS